MEGAQCFVPTTRASFEHDADFLRALQGFISDATGSTFKHCKGSFRTAPGFLSGITWAPFTTRMSFLTRQGCHSMWKGAQCFVPTKRASFEHDADFLRVLQGFISDATGITFKHYKGSFRTTPGFLSGITWVPFTARIFS